MHTANTQLMLTLADARLNDLERRANSERPRFSWLMRRAKGVQNTSAQNTAQPRAPLTRRKAY